MANTINDNCICCRKKRYIDDIRASEQMSPEVDEYLLDAQGIIDRVKPDMTMLQLSSALEERYHQTFGIKNYTDIKHHFNNLMLSMEERFRSKINRSEDPFACALKLMMVGNYIDFGIFKEVDEEKLKSLLENSDSQMLNTTTVNELKMQLQDAKNLMYITDNCGEIILDKLFIERLHYDYPRIHVTVMVRGGNVVNDATLDDAKETGLDTMAEIIDNGGTFAGTQLNKLPEASKKKVLESDLIISKGQANAESLFREGLNVYYCLLCKCDYFAKLMNSEKMQAILYKE